MKDKFFVLALAAMAAFSCTLEEKEEEPVFPGNDTSAQHLTLTAYAPGSESTRTEVKDGGAQVLWQVGDRIKVCVGPKDDLQYAIFESTNTEPCAVAEFRAVEMDSGFEEAFANADKVRAVYPVSERTAIYDYFWDAPLYEVQEGVAGSFAPGLQVTAAESSTKELHFHHVTGGFRFSFVNDDVEEIILKGVGDSRSMEIDQFSFFMINGLPTIGVSSRNPLIVTLKPSEGKYFKAGQWYYVVLAPLSVPSGLTITIQRKDVYSDVTIDKSIGIESGVFGSFQEIDKNLSFSRNVRDVLMDLYYALDGPNWKKQKNWGSDKDILEWEGITNLTNSLNSFEINFSGAGLKGEIPECIGDLGGKVRNISIYNEPGLTGALPASITQLKNLNNLYIYNTSITSLPDDFSGLNSLTHAAIYHNGKLECALPESLGSLPEVSRLTLNGNSFTGHLPSSWARFGDALNLNQNRLTGTIPQSYFDSESSRVLLYNILYQQEGYGFNIDNVELPGYARFWPSEPLEDLDGNVFNFEKIVAEHRYTVYLFWAPWCPFSGILVPQLRDYYDQYSQDGLEVVATVQASEPVNGASGLWEDLEGQKREVSDKRYDKWYNFYWTRFFNSFLMSTPNAEVYDNKGNVVFSSVSEFDDPVRKRFSKSATSELIPFLESLFGPAGGVDDYESWDYSADGDVLTLQRATRGKGINIVFMGDAFTDKDMASGGKYETTMRQAMEGFFALEPYKSLRDRFNVYAVKVVSPNGRIGGNYNTALGTHFGTGSYVDANREKCFEYALKVPGINSRENLLVSVLINTRRHCGTTFMYDTLQSSVAFSPTYGEDWEMMSRSLQHESGGHGMAFLADEYYTSSSAIPQSEIDYHRSYYDQFGWFANVDFTNDPSAIRWSAFLSDPRYSGKVGIFEGGALFRYGAYRPTQNSVMNEQGSFNAPSRQAIYKRVMELSGEGYSFESFLEFDAAGRSEARQAAPARKRAEDVHREHLAPPVIVH